MEQEAAIRFLSTLAYSCAAISAFLLAFSMQLMRTGRKKGWKNEFTQYGIAGVTAGAASILFVLTSVLSIGMITNIENGALPDGDVVILVGLLIFSIGVMALSLYRYITSHLQRS